MSDDDISALHDTTIFLCPSCSHYRDSLCLVEDNDATVNIHSFLTEILLLLILLFLLLLLLLLILSIILQLEKVTAFLETDQVL